MKKLAGFTIVFMFGSLNSGLSHTRYSQKYINKSGRILTIIVLSALFERMVNSSLEKK